MRLDPACLPDEIERRSFEIIDAEISPGRRPPGRLWDVARRCVHACGDTGILEDLLLEEAGLERGVAALKKGCAIFTDTRMLAAGLVERRMGRLGASPLPLMGIPGVEEKARAWGCTRSKAGIRMIADKLAGAIVAIGNAPTALLGLLGELQGIDASLGPALIVGMPVGFVNAAQSKELLCQSPWPKFVLRGRKGGSAIAAAAVNALAELALQGLSAQAGLIGKRL